MRFLRLARRCSTRSNHGFKLGAVVIRGGRVIASGYNHVSRLSNGIVTRSVHAEEDVIRKAGENLRGCAIIVVRVLKSGKMSMSLPCNRCMPLIVESGIRTIIYTDWTGELQIRKV